MNEEALKGRNLTIRVFLSVLLISVYTIVYYQLMVKNIDAKKLTQQIIRLGLTILMMYFIFKGKTWAKTTMSVLLSLAILVGIVSLFMPLTIAGMIPLIVMLFIYFLALYHLNFSVYFIEYFKYLKSKNSESGE